MSTKNPIPKFLRVTRITARDLEIYKRAVVEGVAQRVVAGEFKLSQPRVNAIVKRVGKWLAMPIPDGFAEGIRCERLEEQIRAHRMRLEFLYNEACEAWRESKKSQITVKFGLDAEGKQFEKERIGKSSPGNVKYLDAAWKYGQARLEFDGMSGDGSVNMTAKDRFPELPRQTEDETMREFRQFIDTIAPQVEAWEKKQGNGGQETGNRSQEMRSRAEQGAAQLRQESAEGRREEDNEKCKMEEVVVESSRQPLSEPLSPIETGNSAVNAGDRGAIESVSKGDKPLSNGNQSLSAESSSPPVADTPAIRKPSPYDWLRPSLKLAVNDNPKGLPRMKLMPPRVYPLRNHYYCTRTGKRIEVEPDSTT